MPVMLRTTDAELRVTTVAGGGLAAVDLDPSSTVSLPLTVVLGTEGSSLGAMEVHRRALGGEPGVFEYDRRSRSFRAHVQPLSDPDGVITGTIGLAIDVTELHQAVDAARAMQRMLECFPNGSINVFDNQLRYVM